MSALLETREPSAQYLEAAPTSLVRQFELLAQAPGGVVRLRELILVLAVQGKLTRRDTLAEPASVLLARILKLKASLIDAGKVKRDRPLPAIDEADPPFDIPQSWCWIRLGSVTNYGSPNKGEAIGPETWVLDLEDIQKSTGRLLRRVRRSERPALSEKNSFQAGDVLYGKLRPYLNKVIVADQPGVCTTELVPFRCFGDWVPQYFRIALSSPAFLDYVNARSYGMKMPRLGTEDARMAPLPLPPLEEQVRIVARVDELMQLCDALEAKGRLEAQQHARLLETLLGTLTDSTTPEELATNWQRVSEHFDLLLDRPEAVDALEQTILQLATSGRFSAREPHVQTASAELADQGPAALPFEVPADWSWIKLGQLTSLVTSGSRSWKDYYSDEGATFIRSQDIKYDRLEFDNRTYVRIPPSAEGVRTQVRPRDVLITITGANVGKAAVAEEPLSEAYVSQHVALVRLLDPRIADYLHLWLVNEHGGRLRLLGSSYGAKPGLNLQNIEDLPVPLPPLEEQVRIVARVAELRRLCADLRQCLAASQATQSRLTGALVESVVSA